MEGVKGPTTLSKIVHNFIETTSVDSMHSVYSGLTKLLMRLWFDSNFSDSMFFLRKHTKYVDKKIRSINLPS